MSEHKNQNEEERVVSNRFVRACAEGRHDDVLLMIEDGEDVNQFDKGLKEDNWQCTDGNEPNSFMRNGLQMAIRNHDMTLLRILDRADADFNFEVDGWISDPENEDRNIRAKVPYDLLDSAAKNGFFDGFRYLLDHKAYSLPAEKDEQTRLLLSAIGGGRFDENESDSGARYALVSYLVNEKGYDVDIVSERNQRPLSEAVHRETDNRILQLILSKGVNPNFDSRVEAKYKVEFTEGFKEDVEDSLFGGFSRFEIMRKVMRKYRATPLGQAVFDAVMYYGEDESDEADNEEYKLKCAEIGENAMSKVKLLLEHGADPYFKNADGVSIMDYFYDSEAIEIGLVRGESAKAVETLLQDWLDGKDIDHMPEAPKPLLN